MDSPLLDPLDPEQRRAVLTASRRRKFGRNEVVFHDGDPGDTLHLVAKGHFAVRISTPLGDIATVRIVGPGEHFGELAVLSPGPRRGGVMSIEGGETLSLHRDAVDQLRQSIDGIDAVLTAALVNEVRRLSAALVDALYVPVEQRIWRRLTELAAMFGGNEPINVPITQDDLAQLAGTARSTANRTLRKGESRSVVQLSRGRITILDLEALRRLAR